MSAASDWNVTPAGVLQYGYTDYRVRDVLEGQADGARRSRVGLRAHHRSGLELRGEWDFASGAVTDLFADLPLHQGRLRVGQFKQPFSLEEQGSSRDTALQERSMVHDAFSLSRRVGLMWTRPLPALTVQASAFAGASEVPSAARGLALRGFAAPIEGEQFHLGVAVAHEQRDDARLRLRARAESRLLPFTPLDSGWQNAVDSTWRAGLETAWLRGPLSLQAEWIALRSEGGQGLDGTGGYLLASWLSGGAQRVLKDGSVRKPVLDDQSRLWEINARLSRVDLQREGARFGKQHQLTLGVTALVGRRWQLAIEHGRWQARRAAMPTETRAERGHLTSARLQFSF